MGKSKNKSIWYQVDEHVTNYVDKPSVGEFIWLCIVIKDNSELPCSADALILRTKKENEQEYTTLNADFFS